MNLNTARIFVKDIVEAKQFYSEKLALPLKADGTKNGYCVFGSGSMELIVEAVPDNAPEEDQVLVGRFTGLSFTVPDVNQKYRELEALGVPFSGLPEKQFWGGTLATMQDPAGNQLQIAQLPGDA